MDGNKFRVTLNFLKEEQRMLKTWEKIFLSKKIVKTSCTVPCKECQEKWIKYVINSKNNMGIMQIKVSTKLQCLWLVRETICS